jgi:hypothetical protein
VNRSVGIILVVAVASALLFPALRAAIQQGNASRLYLGVWVVTVGIIAAGAWFPVRAPRRAQSWVCAVLLWIMALLFLTAAFIEVAWRYPHD